MNIRDTLLTNVIFWVVQEQHSPVGAGVGPAQLVGFPHQKASEDPVEDVPLLSNTQEQKTHNPVVKTSH